MTDKETIMAYRQMINDIAREHNITDFEKNEYLQEAIITIMHKCVLTDNQKVRLYEKLNALTSVTHHNYEYIETKSEPILHTRLYHTSAYEGERYDTIAGYIVSFQSEKLKEDKKYSIKELLNEYI